MYSRHCSSLPNRATNDGMSSGRSSGSIVISPPIADGRHHSRSMLQINLIRSVLDRQFPLTMAGPVCIAPLSEPVVRRRMTSGLRDHLREELLGQARTGLPVTYKEL